MLYIMFGFSKLITNDATSSVFKAFPPYVGEDFLFELKG